MANLFRLVGGAGVTIPVDYDLAPGGTCLQAITELHETRANLDPRIYHRAVVLYTNFPAVSAEGNLKGIKTCNCA